jgi:hypothetical protein
MDRLRTHQLLYPELVTEGMNRLAQALICLTEPADRAAYNAELGLHNQTEQEVAQERPTDRSKGNEQAETQAEEIPDEWLLRAFPPEPEEQVPTQPPAADMTQVLEVPFTAGLAPPERTASSEEGAASAQPKTSPPAPALPYEVVWEPDTSPQEVARGGAEVVEANLVALPAAQWSPRTRRQIFARLASIRHLLASWQKLKPVLADPREPLTRVSRVLAFLEAVVEVRPLLPALRGLVGEPGRPGGLVAAIVLQPLVVPSFRMLLPDQRLAIARDWRKAEFVLGQEYKRLRELVRTTRPVRKRTRRRWRNVWLTRTPEVVLVVLILVVMIVALIR